MEHMAVVLLHPRYPFENHHNGAPFGTHVDGLEGGIKH